MVRHLSTGGPGANATSEHHDRIWADGIANRPPELRAKTQPSMRAAGFHFADKTSVEILFLEAWMKIMP